MNNFIENLKAVLSTTPQQWHQITQNYPDDLLRRQPLAGEWSALECLLHLMDMDKFVFSARVKIFLEADENKGFEPFFPDKQGTKLSDDMSAIDLAKQFEMIRSESLALIDTIPADALANQVTHSALGVVTLSQLLYDWGGHDLMHLVQANQALMQPFIEGCGPWKPYFGVHIAGASEA